MNEAFAVELYDVIEEHQANFWIFGHTHGNTPNFNIGSFSKRKGIHKSQLSKNGYPCIRYGELYTTHHYVINEFKSYVSEEVSKESVEISYIYRIQ